MFLIESKRMMGVYGPEYFERAFAYWEKCLRRWQAERHLEPELAKD